MVFRRRVSPQGFVIFESSSSTATQERATIPIAAGLAGSLAGAPIVHFAHGKIGRGFASLGMRLTAWTITALSGGDGVSDPKFAAVGLVLLGGVAALDATAFGYADHPTPGSADRAPSHTATAPRWSVSPVLARRPGVALTFSF